MAGAGGLWDVQGPALASFRWQTFQSGRLNGQHCSIHPYVVLLLLLLLRTAPAVVLWAGEAVLFNSARLTIKTRAEIQ